MGGACSDENRQPDSVTLEYAMDYNRSNELPTEEVDIQRTVSPCGLNRDSRVSLRKRLRQSPALYSFENPEARFSIPKQQVSQPFVAKKADPQSLRLHSPISAQESDYETKMKVKQVLEPMVKNNVRRIVNDTVDELFKNIFSTANLESHCQSQTAEHMGLVNDSRLTHHNVNSLDMQNNKVSSDLSACKLKGKVPAEFPPRKAAWNQKASLKFVSDQSSDTSDVSSGFIGSSRALWAPSPGCLTTIRRVSTIKLYDFPTDSSELESPDNLNPSKLMSTGEGCIGVEDTRAETLRKKQLVLADEDTNTKLAGDGKRSLGDEIRFENEHLSKILTPVTASISQSPGIKTTEQK